eukprot:756670-Hanusia_phi.AAC.12
MVWFASSHTRDDQKIGKNSEQFTSGGRQIPAGLTAADVVSKWTWAATLLQSSNVAYQQGVSGPFWYAAGATIQVILFATLAIEIKRKCPAIHTVLEVVLVRWGVAAHLVFLFFCVLTNLIVTAMLILGGAATVEALTGVNVYAASFLIPIPVCVYTAFGGLKGTYYASFTHTVIIFIALLIFMWKIYAGPSDIGSSNKMYDNLVCDAIKMQGTTGLDYTTGNSNGSLLTMWSQGGLIFGIVNIVGNFGTVFVDQSYWQGAIACQPSATWKGYLLGGISWFAIPFSMATSLGLAAHALDLPITPSESAQGLVPPAVATHLLGEGGAFLIAFQLFLAVTSTANSEQLAVSSLISYDIYKRYINPNATGKQIIFVSRAGIVFWAIVSGVVAAILKQFNISLGWVYMSMGNFIGSAVVPITFSLTWKNCTALGAILGALGGLAAAFIGWFSVAASLNGGVINVDTLGGNYPMLTGNLLALCVSPIICVIVSLMNPQNYDWKELEEKTGTYLVEDDPHAHLKATGGEDSKEAMDNAYYWVTRGGALLSIVLILIWPLLALPENPFSKSYFGWWVAIAFIWGHMAFLATVVYPVVQYFLPPRDIYLDPSESGAGEPAKEMQQSVHSQGVQPPAGFVLNPAMGAPGMVMYAPPYQTWNGPIQGMTTVGPFGPASMQGIPTPIFPQA